MNRTSTLKILLGLAILFLILSMFSVYKGFDKLMNYYNSESYPSLNKNAYVGGDAYNFIINGNYATGFFVLSMGLLICSVLCIGTGAIIGAIPETVSTFDNKLPVDDLPEL